MEVANARQCAPKSGADYVREPVPELCAIREQPGRLSRRADDLERLGAFQLPEQRCIELDDRARVVPCFGRGHLLDACLDAALGADGRALAQRGLELGKAWTQGGRKVRAVEVAQMVAERANQALLDRTVADQSLDGLRETLGEVRHALVVRRLVR